jgi:crotonobetainyl-CoA:carnitine CoA-transferase CaiB-like acyl-CoA transferase
VQHGKPLDAVTVLDLTRLLPGAFCTLMLADLGARVIKIEDPAGGDPVREMTPVVDGHSVYFHSLNRDKYSVTIDLRQPRGLDVLDSLAARADVLVESFRPSTARRLRVDGTSMCARHPRLVHCAISGFGQSGPYVERAGHDINYLALAGMLAIDTPSAASADVPAAPHVPRMFLADIGGGALTAMAGILAALFARERTGRGTAIDISMHEGALAWLTFPAARALIAGGDVTSSDLPIFAHQACYNVYRAADGKYIALGALEPKFWRRFCDTIGRPDFGARQFDGGAAQAALHAEVAAIIEGKTREQWLTLFANEDACLTTVNTVAEALEDRHVAARHAVKVQSGHRFISAPIRFGNVPPDSSVRPAPALGADTDDVLAQAGLDADTRQQLRAAHVI